MANRYEVIEKSTGKVIMPASGNVGLENFFDQCGEDWDVIEKVRDSRIDSDCNRVHSYFVEERVYS